MPLVLRVPALDQQGDMGDIPGERWDVVATSDALPDRPVQSIEVTVAEWEDQDWGNKGCRLGLCLYDASGTLLERRDLFGEYRGDEFEANYRGNMARVFPARDPIVKKAARDAVYKLEYCMNRHVSHSIRLRDWTCTIFFDEESGKLELRRKIQEYTVALGKATAGLVRFFFEDMVSGLCQCIYLCKLWKTISLSSKAFTLASIFTGVALSLAGPMLELIKARQLNVDPALHEEIEEPPEALEEAAGPLLGPGASPAGKPNATGGAKWNGNQKSPEVPPEDERVGITVVPDVKIAQVVYGQSPPVRRLLFIVAALFWLSMMCLPFVFPMKCGQPVTGTALLVFAGLSVLASCLEIWVTIRTQTGYLLFKHASMKYLLGIVFGHLGRFDTYSDVVFAKMVQTCEPITWFSIWEHYFYIPFGVHLSQIVLATFILGVILCQAVPGVALLATSAAWSRKWLPLALKLNEYSLLLAVMEVEATGEQANDEREEHEAKRAVMQVNDRLGVVATVAAGVATQAAIS